MTTPSEDRRRETEGFDRRLHPLSWLFVLIDQLKAFAVPLLILVVTGRGNSYEFFGIYGVGFLIAVSVVRYYTYRFRLDAGGIVIRSGVLQTTRRDIPYERIHNVSLHQSLVHRLFGVAELRLESAGGDRAEAEMRVLSLSDAQALETLIRGRGAGRALETTIAAPEGSAEFRTLLALDTLEVVRLGLISNKGMVLVAAAFGALWQFVPEPWMSRRAFLEAYRWFTPEVAELVPHWLLRPAGVVLMAILLLAGALVVVRALSVLLALLQFHGFTLQEVGRQLRVERGLLTRVRTHLPRRRIQAWRLREGLLHRWFHRQSLRVDSAGGAAAGQQESVRDLAPLATPAAMQALISHVLRRSDWPPERWLPLHPQAWRRLLATPSAILVGIAALLTWRFGSIGLVVLVTAPLIVIRARLWARHAGYAESGRLIAVRTGWISRSWEFADVRKLQSLRLTASPFDRRYDMMTIWLDTAGVSSRDGLLRIPYLPSTEARALYDRLSAGMDISPEAATVLSQFPLNGPSPEAVV